jgi:hypothetical protein
LYFPAEWSFWKSEQQLKFVGLPLDFHRKSKFSSALKRQTESRTGKLSANSLVMVFAIVFIGQAQFLRKYQRPQIYKAVI